MEFKKQEIEFETSDWKYVYQTMKKRNLTEAFVTKTAVRVYVCVAEKQFQEGHSFSFRNYPNQKVSLDKVKSYL